MYALTVMGDVVVLAKDKPMTVVCVEAPTVTTVAADVPTFLFKYLVNVLAICYPKAIAIATAVPAGSTCKFVCAPATVVAPVPPLTKFNVPATVTAPAVAVAGVKPVVPKLIVLTAIAEAADHVGAEPFDVSTCPFVPIPSLVNAVPEA